MASTQGFADDKESGSSITSAPNIARYADVLATWQITTEFRHGCKLLRIYRPTATCPYPWINNEWKVPAEPNNFNGGAGPVLWRPGEEGEHGQEQRHSPGKPLRCFVFSAPDGTGKRFGTCSMLSQIQFLAYELPVDYAKLTDVVSSGYQRCGLHRRRSILMWLKKHLSFSSTYRKTGLIRRTKGWRMGWCGHAAMAGYAPCEILDGSSTVEWLDCHYLFGWVWRLQETNENGVGLQLTCHARRSGPPLCRLRFALDDADEVGPKPDIHEEEANMTFELLEPYQEVWDTLLHNMMGGEWRLEKLLYHGVALAEKVRKRRSKS